MLPSSNGNREAAAGRREEREPERKDAGRRERIPLDSNTLKLSAPKRKGFHRHWFNDAPGRTAAAQAAGYEFVRDGNTQSDGLGVPVERRVGVAPDGTSLNAYLMEIPQAWYDEDQARQQEPLDEFDRQIKRGVGEVATSHGQDSEAFYTPKGGVSVKVSGPKGA